MASVSSPSPLRINAHLNEESRLLSPKMEFSIVNFPSNIEFPGLNFNPSWMRLCASKQSGGRVHSSPTDEDSKDEKAPTPILDTIENPTHLKNLTLKELKQLAGDIHSEFSNMAKTDTAFRASLSAVELTVAIHHVFNAPSDKILWDMEDQTHAHKLLTGRRPTPIVNNTTEVDDRSVYTCRSEYDPFATGHGCSSISSGLGMAVARDIKGNKNRVVSVISNETTMAGQVYEAMGNAGYLDSNMVVILNDRHHPLHPKLDQAPKASINALSSFISKFQSSKLFRKFRELAKILTKRFGRGMHEWAAKVDEFARGMVGPTGSTLFEELGLYYIGPVDGHNIEDLICVLREVASLDSMGPVLVHVITKDRVVEYVPKVKIIEQHHRVCFELESVPINLRVPTYSEHFAKTLVKESETDEDIVVVHAGMGMEPSFQLLKDKFGDKFFDVGMAEQHAVTFSAGLSCGGLKPFCIIPAAFLQRAYDQVVHDVDRQKIPVRFAITNGGLVGSDGPAHSGAFDVAFMSCLPNMIVMAPSDEIELSRMVATAVNIDDRPVCFRYPRALIPSVMGPTILHGEPITIGRGRLLLEGNHIALLGYGTMVNNCLRAHTILAKLGIQVSVADARFCKPLDTRLVRMLCKNHRFLITVEEGSVGGFGSHVAQFMSLDGLLDAGIKWRPITLPDNYIEGAPPDDQIAKAGLSGSHIAATALNLLGRTRDALQLMMMR